MSIKVGFVSPLNSTGLPDSGNALTNLVRALPLSDKDHVGVVVLQIYGAKDLPKWPNGEVFVLQHHIAADRIASDSHGVGCGSFRESVN